MCINYWSKRINCVREVHYGFLKGWNPWNPNFNTLHRASVPVQSLNDYTSFSPIFVYKINSKHPVNSEHPTFAHLQYDKYNNVWLIQYCTDLTSLLLCIKVKIFPQYLPSKVIANNQRELHIDVVYLYNVLKMTFCLFKNEKNRNF